MSALPKVTGTTVYEGLEVSYGVAPILNTFANLSGQSTRPKWNLYLINAETLIRNRREDTLPPDQLGREVLNDMQVLAQYISAYNRNNNAYFEKRRPCIFFYLPHYESSIPKQYLRDKFPKGTEIRWQVRDVIDEILKRESMNTEIDTTRINYTSIGHPKHPWPHKELLKDIVSQLEGAQFYKCLMISHVPLDFHLYRCFADFHVLESYTGALKQRRDFGKKVFQDESIPFNKYTHLVLGDKWYIKAIANTPKIKKMIKERAQKERWNLLPDKGVLSALLKIYPPSLPTAHAFVDPDI